MVTAQLDTSPSQAVVKHRRALCIFALALAILLGGYIRLHPVLLADFPLNDGGLFWQMAREIRASHYVLPAFTHFNAERIPFAYPPLGFYMAALVADATGASLLDVLRLLPAFWSCLAGVAFYLLSRSVLRSRLGAALATLLWVLLPYTWEWFIMGGGLTRAPGQCFALLTLWNAHEILRGDGRKRRIAFLTVCFALCALSHAGQSWVALLSVVLMVLFFGNRGKASSTLLAMGAGILLAVPWWGTVLRYHGAEPLLAAMWSGQHGGAVWEAVKGSPLGAGGLLFVPIIAAVIWLLVWRKLRQLSPGTRRRWFLPIWLLSLLIVASHSAATSIAVPLALLVGAQLRFVVLGPPKVSRRYAVLVCAVLLGILGEYTKFHPREGLMFVVVALCAGGTAIFSRVVLQRLPSVAAMCLLGIVGVILLISGAQTSQGIEVVLPQSQRMAMDWMAKNTSIQSSVLVLPQHGTVFGADPLMEWFPALTGRISPATAQGSEWLAPGTFFLRLQRLDALRNCRDLGCVTQWPQQSSTRVQYIFVPKMLAAPPGQNKPSTIWNHVLVHLRKSAQHKLVFENSGAVIFRDLKN